MFAWWISVLPFRLCMLAAYALHHVPYAKPPPYTPHAFFRAELKSSPHKPYTVMQDIIFLQQESKVTPSQLCLRLKSAWKLCLLTSGFASDLMTSDSERFALLQRRVPRFCPKSDQFFFSLPSGIFP